MSDPGDLRWLMSLSLTGRPPRISVDPPLTEDAKEQIAKYREYKKLQAEAELAEIEQELDLRREVSQDRGSSLT